MGFLAGDHAVADDEGEGHERHQQPKAVEGNGETDEPHNHAEVDGVAREVIGASVDDRRGRHAGGYGGACPGEGSDRPGGQRERYANTAPPTQPAGAAAGMNGKGMSHCKASAASTASAHAIGGRMMTLAVSAVSLMARLVNLHSWRCKRFDGYLPASLNACGFGVPSFAPKWRARGDSSPAPQIRPPAPRFT